MENKFDVIIIGSGPAGLTAAIYTSRANLSTLLVAGSPWGGQLMLTTEVENYPGFPEGILGPELMKNMRKQAERFGTKIIDDKVTKVDFAKSEIKEVFVGETQYLGNSVIVATGADSIWLGVDNEQKLIGRGVSSCAPCDAFFFKDKKVCVVGGGDSAMEEALVLSRFATEVTIIHRREEFRASKIMQERVRSNPKIKIMFNTVVVGIIGDQKVEGIKIKTTESGNEVDKELLVDGVFVAIGHKPNTDIFDGQLTRDEKGYLVRGVETKEGDLVFKSNSSKEGVFIAGDVHDHKFRQAITAAAYGCEAALEAERYLEEKGLT